MNKIIPYLIICIAALAFFAGYGAAAEDDENEYGLLHITCNVNTASVSIISNNSVIGTSSPGKKGYCDFYVNSKKTPINMIIASDDNYCTSIVNLSSSPAPGKRQDVSISLGGAQYPSDEYGYICIYTNVFGAKVEAKTKYNIDTFSGYTNQYGYAQIPVNGKKYTITKIIISAPGWVTQTLEETVLPKDHRKIRFEVVLEKPVVPTPTPTPIPTATPVPEETRIILGYPTIPKETPTTPPASPLGLATVATGLTAAVLFLRKD